MPYLNLFPLVVFDVIGYPSKKVFRVYGFAAEFLENQAEVRLMDMRVIFLTQVLHFQDISKVLYVLEADNVCEAVELVFKLPLVLYPWRILLEIQEGKDLRKVAYLVH